MRRLLSVALVGALLVIAATPLVSAAGGDPFTRSWSAIDVDGSVMTLSFVGNGPTRTVTFIDSRATTCGGDVYEASGMGTITDDVIVVVFTGGCVGDTPGASPDPATIVFQAGSNTLSFGDLIWHRGSRAREAFLGAWKATDVDGSAMKLRFRGSGLVRAVIYRDNRASSCDPDAAFWARGSGVVGSVPPWGKYITVSLEGACVGGASIDIADAMYRYDYLTDTLRGPLDPGGGEVFGTVDWHRGG